MGNGSHRRPPWHRPSQPRRLQCRQPPSCRHHRQPLSRRHCLTPSRHHGSPPSLCHMPRPSAASALALGGRLAAGTLIAVRYRGGSSSVGEVSGGKQTATSAQKTTICHAHRQRQSTRSNNESPQIVTVGGGTCDEEVTQKPRRRAASRTLVICRTPMYTTLTLSTQPCKRGKGEPH